MALYRGQLEQRFGEAPALSPKPKARVRKVFLDFETFCDLDLKKVGLDRYSAHPSCKMLMAAYCLDGKNVDIWDATREEMPDELYEALMDDRFEIHAFNAQFERIILDRVLGIKPDVYRFRCTMVHAYLHSYFGGLDQIVVQMRLPSTYRKDARGTKLMKMFSSPQRVTKNQPHRVLTRKTNPNDWEDYLDYCVQDVIAEMGIHRRLDKDYYPIPEEEWEFYAIDQIINDRGLPVDLEFVEGAIALSDKRKAILARQMRDICGLSNPNSGTQLLPWLQKRGYPYDDLRKDSVKKVLTAWKGVQDGTLKKRKGELYPELTSDCEAILKLRQQSARTSVRKYNALKDRVGADGRIRFVFQFAGASRTARFAGRAFQPQNLTTLRLPGDDKHHVKVMEQLIEIIRNEDYGSLALMMREPLDALAGLVRCAIRPHRKKQLVVCDLSSIESVVIGWVARCERLLNVFRDGKDAYKDFATELFGVTYEEVTKDMRKQAKPATLGSGYRLGGGEIRDGKKTGLWGYAENMGIDMTRKEAHRGTAVFRRVYKEIVKCWYDLEDAIKKTIRHGVPTKVGFIRFTYEAPYLMMHLPSGRIIYYRDPKVSKRPFRYTDRETGEIVTVMKDSISYMGKTQNGSTWTRIDSHGGKFIENAVQAIARDILREGLMLMHRMGFTLIGHVHDEAIAEERIGSDFDLAFMRECMIKKIKWLKNCPLGAAGFVGAFYRKD